MLIQITTELNSTTGKNMCEIGGAIAAIQEAQCSYLLPAGITLISKGSSNHTMEWFSYIDVPKHICKQIQKYYRCDKMPDIMRSILRYVDTVEEYNRATSGNCEIAVRWSVGDLLNYLGR